VAEAGLCFRWPCTHPVAKAIGIELSETRLDQAGLALQQLQQQGCQLRPVSFEQADLSQCSLQEGTHFYLCSTAFGAGICRCGVSATAQFVAYCQHSFFRCRVTAICCAFHQQHGCVLQVLRLTLCWVPDRSTVHCAAVSVRLQQTDVGALLDHQTARCMSLPAAIASAALRVGHHALQPVAVGSAGHEGRLSLLTRHAPIRC